jgi:hypothetical protein
VAATAGLGGPHHVRYQRGSRAKLAQRRVGHAVRPIPAGASVSTIQAFGRTSEISPTKNCWRCTAGASAA